MTARVAVDDPVIGLGEESPRAWQASSAATDAFERAAHEAGVCLIDANQSRAAEILRQSGLDGLERETSANKRRFWELHAEIVETPAHH